MTFKKARRRYPYCTPIKYIGNKTLRQMNLHYDLDRGMKWREMIISHGNIGFVDDYIFDPVTGHDVIGVRVSFKTGSYMEECYEPVPLYFREDLFVRAF